MEKNSKIYVAGHRGMVGSAIVRELRRQGYDSIITRTHAELDLTRQFGEDNAAAFVNGILDAAAKAAENGTLLPGPDTDKK